MASAAARDDVKPQVTARESFVRELRRLRAEVQDLQTNALKRIASGEVELATEVASIENTMQNIAALMANVERYESDSAGSVSSPWEVENLRHILNAWEVMKVNPLLSDPRADYTTQNLLRNLNMITEQIDSIIFRIGMVTIPVDVGKKLERLQPGQCFSFHQTFKTELPDAEERESLLDHLSRTPDVPGVVDKATGLVFAYSPDPRERAKRARLLYGFFGLATIAVGLSGLLDFTPSPDRLLMGWLFLVLGVFVHAVLGVYKSGMRGDASMYNMLGQFDKIIDTRLSLIVLQTVVMVIALYALVFAMGQAGTLQPGNAFLTGYSLDSFLGLFSAAIERGAGAQGEAVKFGI